MFAMAPVDAVRRLFYPAAECQTSTLEKVEQLWNGVCTVPRMQQSIGKRHLISKIQSLSQQTLLRMAGRQRAERTAEIATFSIGGVDTNPSAELLQHVYAGPPVRRVHHQLHRPVRLEHAAQGGKPRIGVCEVMENSGTHDLIEVHPQVTYLFDGQLVNRNFSACIFL
jgi:hypothetical protein